MRNVTLETFTDSLTQLRQALADADPLAAPSGAPFAASAGAVAGAFVRASAHDRARFLLRALDDAIAAVEVSARLADDLHGAGNGAAVAEPPTDTGDDPLLAAYRAFAESQPAYAALYQYRNALAASLRVGARAIPDAILTTTSAEPAADAPAAPAAPAKPRSRRPRKALPTQS